MYNIQWQIAVQIIIIAQHITDIASYIIYGMLAQPQDEAQVNCMHLLSKSLFYV